MIDVFVFSILYVLSVGTIGLTIVIGGVKLLKK